MKKPIKPKKPVRFVFPPQKKIYSQKCYWEVSNRGAYYEDPIEKALDEWDGESDPAELWKSCCLDLEGYISLAEVIKLAEKNGLKPEEIYFGLSQSEDYISASVFSINEEDESTYYYDEMVKNANYQEKIYQRELAQYEKDMNEYPLKRKQYLEHQKQKAEQELIELEKE